MPGYLNRVVGASLSLSTTSPVVGVQPQAPTDVVLVSRMLAAAYVSFQVSGVWQGQIVFEVSNDASGPNNSSTWNDVLVHNPQAQPGDPLSASANGNGVFWFLNTGFENVRARLTQLLSGNPRVVGIALPLG